MPPATIGNARVRATILGCIKGRESCTSMAPGMLPAGQTTVQRSAPACAPLPRQCIGAHAECSCFGPNMACHCSGADGALGLTCNLP